MATGVLTLDLADINSGDGIRLRDKGGNEATGPVVRNRYTMTVELFGQHITFARWSDGAGRTRTGRWMPHGGMKIVGHQPAMF